MATFRPKEAFRDAKEAEKKGRKKVASQLYASVGLHLRKIGKLKEAKTVFEKAIELSPDSARLYLQLAVIEAGENNMTSAKRAVEKFTRVSISRGKTNDYKPYMEDTLKDHPSLRQVFYSGILEVDRTSAASFMPLAEAQVQQGNLEEAQKILLDALKTKTMDEEVLMFLKEVLRQRNIPEQKAHLKNYLADKISRDDLILLLSESSKEKFEAEEPVDEEKNLNTLIHELEIEMGIQIDEGHDSVKPLIREFRRKSQKILDGDAKARMDMATAFFEMGLVEDAREELEPIASVDPKYLEAQCLLGEILYSEGSDLGALDAFQRCLRDDRASLEVRAEARYKLVLVYMRLGDKDRAFEHAEALQKIAPNYRDVNQLKRQLQESLDLAKPAAVEGKKKR